MPSNLKNGLKNIPQIESHNNKLEKETPGRSRSFVFNYSSGCPLALRPLYLISSTITLLGKVKT